MKTADGYLCSEEEINGGFFDSRLEPDWTIYADCMDCPAHWRGEWGATDEATRYRVDEHIRQTGHRVQWRDTENEMRGTDPVVIAGERTFTR